MKKYSFLLGALGSALAGYLLSNAKLRKELSSAKDPATAAKTLGSHLQHDGQRLAKEVKAFAESDEVQHNVRKAKDLALEKFMEAKKQVARYVATKRKK